MKKLQMHDIVPKIWNIFVLIHHTGTLIWQQIENVSKKENSVWLLLIVSFIRRCLFIICQQDAAIFNISSICHAVKNYLYSLWCQSLKWILKIQWSSYFTHMVIFFNLKRWTHYVHANKVPATMPKIQFCFNHKDHASFKMKAA